MAIKIASFTLADGSTQKALVPKVYTRQAVGQIDGTGSLIAANNLVVNVTGDVNNRGQLVGHNNAYIKSLNLTNEVAVSSLVTIYSLTRPMILLTKRLLKQAALPALKLVATLTTKATLIAPAQPKA